MAGFFKPKSNEQSVSVPRELPILPLRDSVAFPFSVIPLSVGIPRSVKLVEEAMEGDSLIGLFGPRSMSNALRESIAADIQAAVAADPTIGTRLAATGQVIDVRGPAEFAAGIKEIRDQLASIAQALGIKAAQ